jgi:hypothetical protein
MQILDLILIRTPETYVEFLEEWVVVHQCESVEDVKLGLANTS